MIDCWIGFRQSLVYDAAGMPEEMKARLAGIVERLKPTDLLNRARAIVIAHSGGGFDIPDGSAASPLGNKVSTHGLAKLTAIAIADCETMRAAFGRCSKLLHSEAAGLNNPLPHPDKIQAEITCIRSAKAFVGQTALTPCAGNAWDVVRPCHWLS